MYHSLTIVDQASNIAKNTYDDYFLVPLSRPTVSVPDVKSKTIDIPGSNGVLDFTESLTQFPVFNNRTGSFDFAVLNDKMDWVELYSKLMNEIHGHKVYLRLEDDPEWQYSGRMTVDSWSPGTDGTWSEVTLGYDFHPFKEKIVKTTKTYTQSSSSSGYVFKDTLTKENLGGAPIIPLIKVQSNNMGLRVSVTNGSTQLFKYEREFTSTGTYRDASCILYNYAGLPVKIFVKGSGTIALEFSERSL